MEDFLPENVNNRGKFMVREVRLRFCFSPTAKYSEIFYTKKSLI